MTGINMQNSEHVHRFMKLYRELCPTVDDEAPLTVFAERLGWPLDATERLALWLDERSLIETDRGMGTGITMVEGRSPSR